MIKRGSPKFKKNRGLSQSLKEKILFLKETSVNHFGKILVIISTIIVCLTYCQNQKEKYRKQLDSYSKLNSIALQLFTISNDYFELGAYIRDKIYPTRKQIFKVYESEWNILNTLPNKSEILLEDSINKLWTSYYDDVNFYVLNVQKSMEDSKNDWMNNQIDSVVWEVYLGKHYNDLIKLCQSLSGYSIARTKELNKKLGIFE
ncbi:MAG TPA: hypothetical protein VN026_01125 [Bacteroidia bacterium]|jgi:hypothetical protein|nr:hypothetical protein [Bacteroidia bacterium]